MDGQRFGDARVLSITPPYVTLRDKAPWVTLPTFNQVRDTSTALQS